MSNSSQLHGLLHARLFCPSLPSRVCSNSCQPLLICPQSFPASQSFPMSQFFGSDGQNIGASALALKNIQDWFPSVLTGLILLSKGLSGVFFSTTVEKHQLFGTQPSLWFNFHIHTQLLGNTHTHTHNFDNTDLFQQSVVSDFNMLSRVLISWLKSQSAVILEPKKI